MSTGSSSHVRIALVSVHHGNTEKVAEAIAEVLGTAVVAPEDLTSADVRACDLLGFGSGIYSGKHHRRLRDLVDRLPTIEGARAFVFSTFGAPGIAATASFVAGNHRSLRERLQYKGFTIVGEFACPGHNTNSFLRFTGGLNRGHPDNADLERAKAFARNLRSSG